MTAISYKIQQLIDSVHVDSESVVDEETSRRLDALSRIDNIVGFLNEHQDQGQLHLEDKFLSEGSSVFYPELSDSIITDALLATYRYRDHDECEDIEDDIIEIYGNTFMYAVTHRRASHICNRHAKCAHDRLSFLDGMDLHLVRKEDSVCKISPGDDMSTGYPTSDTSIREIDTSVPNRAMHTRKPVIQKVAVVTQQSSVYRY